MEFPVQVPESLENIKTHHLIHSIGLPVHIDLEEIITDILESSGGNIFGCCCN